MGGGGSKEAPPPPRIVEEPYPGMKGITNLSLSSSASEECLNCDIAVDTKVTTSSVSLTREYGDISTVECKKYQKDLDAVRAKEMSFQDFYNKLQLGQYHRPASNTANGEFCEQIMFGDDEESAKVVDIASFDARQNLLKTIRIRKVSAGGGFSKGTKATYKLSIPITFEYTQALTFTPPPVTTMSTSSPWQWITTPSSTQSFDVKKVKISISKFTLYHPSPLRIENVQHDAVLSLESEPRSSSTGANISEVILVPLRGTNLGTDSEKFFNKIVKQIISIGEPEPSSGIYNTTEIATGSDWNIKNLFWLSPQTNQEGLAKITDEYYTWTGFGGYKFVQKSNINNVITYGWTPDNSLQTRYFMLANPVGISTTDLALLTRNLPSTPPEEAIHSIPDPSLPGNNKVYHKRAEEPALSGTCGTKAPAPLTEAQEAGEMVRENMSNPEDVINRVFSSGSTDFLDASKNEETCDPFVLNARSGKTNTFTPMQMAQAFFNFMILIGLLIGAWLGLFFVTKDYDVKYREFSENTGTVLGTFMKRLSQNASDTSYAMTA